MKTQNWKHVLLEAGFLLSLAVAPGAMLGCAATVGYSDPGYNDEDDYVYYPDYGIYYGARHHQYVYMEGNTWRRGNSPPGVQVDALSTSASVQMDFHDAPERHHSQVVGKYPRHSHDGDNGGDHGGDHGNDHRDPGNDHHN